MQSLIISTGMCKRLHTRGKSFLPRTLDRRGKRSQLSLQKHGAFLSSWCSAPLIDGCCPNLAQAVSASHAGAASPAYAPNFAAGGMLALQGYLGNPVRIALRILGGPVVPAINLDSLVLAVALVVN